MQAEILWPEKRSLNLDRTEQTDAEVSTRSTQQTCCPSVILVKMVLPCWAYTRIEAGVIVIRNRIIKCNR